MKIGVFGGSFDPPTKSHLRIAEQLLEKSIVDRVLFMPAYETSHGKQLSSFLDRHALLFELCWESEYETGIFISSFESQGTNGKTFDVMTSFLSECDDGDTYYFIMGMDNAVNIQSFYRWKDLIKLMPFIVLNRNGIVCDDELWFKKEPHQYVNNIEIADASSTQIRNELKNMYTDGLSQRFFEMCDVSVFKYIMREGMYGV